MLLRAVAEKVGLPLPEVYQKAGIILEEKYGLYEGFEKALKEGTEALTKLEIPEDIAKAFVQVAEERIHIKMVKVRGTLEIRCMKPNGVKCIKKPSQTPKKRRKLRIAKIEFSVIAAPKYSVEASADNWKRAEEIFEKVSQNVVTNITKAGGRALSKEKSKGEHMRDTSDKTMWGQVEKLGKGTKANYDPDKKTITFCFNRNPQTTSEQLKKLREPLMKELRN